MQLIDMYEEEMNELMRRKSAKNAKMQRSFFLCNSPSKNKDSRKSKKKSGISNFSNEKKLNWRFIGSISYVS
jgi:hypothetical protein